MGLDGQEVSIKRLEDIIGYKYNNIELLREALTHSSYSHEMASRHIKLNCNERLEFLGDSVLSIITSEYLFLHFSDRPEGDLTKIRAEVVCERACAKYARKIGLGKYLLLGNGEEKNNGRTRPSAIADAFEALLASMYIDSGMDKERVKEFLLPFIIAETNELEIHKTVSGDYKTALQQFVQQTEGDFLEYIIVGESGPDHQKRFDVEARLNSNVIGKGSGKSKREAEQNAAKAAIELFGVEM